MNRQLFYLAFVGIVTLGWVGANYGQDFPLDRGVIAFVIGLVFGCFIAPMLYDKSFTNKSR